MNDGEYTSSLGARLIDILEEAGRSDIEVFYDHSKGAKSSPAVPHFGEYGHGTTLANVDIAITSGNKILMLAEIEESQARPKTIIGDIANIYLATGIRIAGKPYEFSDAKIIFGSVANPDGKGKKKAEALANLIPNSILPELRRNITVKSVVVDNQKDLVDQLADVICRELGITLTEPNQFS